MTIQQSIHEARQIILESDSPDREEIAELLEICSKNLHTMKWSKEMVFDACQQFILDNNREITVGDFDRAKLPRHTTIQKLFGMTAAEFRDTYFPMDNKKVHDTSKYRAMKTDRMVAAFRREYGRIQPTSSPDFTKRYNNKKCPNWATLCTRLGLPIRWKVLREALELPVYQREKLVTPKAPHQRAGSGSFQTSSHAPLYQKWERVNKKLAEREQAQKSTTK
jgi:hypothetical protein